ncbi:hypothetical protein V2A85_22430 [Yersinia sp. 1252 StPb PI]|uniref:hypothetical protein n=1 Tax=Yersinia sp. 1252 StPb PI TaxID=3117404 RepID=UPI003B281DC4
MDQASTSCLYIDPVAFPVEGVVVDCCYMATATNTTTGIGVDTNNSVGNSSIKDVKISNTTFNTSASGVRFTGNCDMIGVSTCSFIGLPATAVAFDQAKNVKMTGCDFQANNFDMFIKDGDNGGPFNIANNNFTSNISQVTTISSRFGKTNNSGY